MSRPNIAPLLTAILFLLMAKPTMAQDWIYYAESGDTLWDLCLKYTAKRGCWLELSEHNNIVEGKNIQPGDKIRIPVDWLLTVPVVGRVLNVNGEVQYRESSMSDWLPLLHGQRLLLGSVIRSDAGSANISLGRDSEILVRRHTTLELNTMSAGAIPGQTTQLNLEKGSVEVEVDPASKSRFEIHTPSAIAAVRGTAYRVSVESVAATRNEVVSGLVAIKAGSDADIPAGYGIRARTGKALSEPWKLLPPAQFSAPRIESALPVKLQWAPQSGAALWQLDLYENNVDGRLLETRTTVTSEFSYETLELGCYLLVARGIDTEGFQGLDGKLPLCVVEATPETLAKEPQSYWGFLLWLVLATAVLL